jgi:hypothetical protein
MTDEELIHRLNALAGEQRFMADDFASMKSDAGRKSAALCAARADLLNESASRLSAVTRERAEMEGERDAWKQNAEEWADKLQRETARMDWLSRAQFVDVNQRVTASDGLRAAMDWSWDPFDGATLRDAIDVELLREAPIDVS